MIAQPIQFRERLQQMTNVVSHQLKPHVRRTLRWPAQLAGLSTQLLEVRNAEHLDGVAAHQLVHDFITELACLLGCNLGGVWPRRI